MFDFKLAFEICTEVKMRCISKVFGHADNYEYNLMSVTYGNTPHGVAEALAFASALVHHHV